MVESGGGARLDLEAPHPVGVTDGVERQNLDRDFTAEPVVPRAPDLAHPARPERREDLIWPEAGARR